MDDSVDGLKFNENGICTLCTIHDELESKYPALKELGDKYRAELEKYRNWEKLHGRGI